MAPRIALRVSAVVAAALVPLLASAATTKEVTIDSAPSGADVFLLQAGKRTLLGTTPVRPQLEFHSEISVLRLSLTKRGFQSESAEISAKQDNLMVRLRPQRLAATPAEIKGQARGVQERIFQKVEEVMAPVAMAGSERGWELSGHIRAVRLDDKFYLLVPLAVSKPPAKASASVARAVWNELAASWLESLGEVARSDRALHGVVIDVRFGEVARAFTVGSKVESRLEMQCVPGTEYIQVYEPCVRQVEKAEWSSTGRESRRMVCEGGLVSRPSYNPCLTRAPVTRSEVVISPEAATRAGQSRIQFVIPAAVLIESKNDKLYSRVDFLHSDATGKVVEKRGMLPASLQAVP